jgi:hypothetical protein
MAPIPPEHHPFRRAWECIQWEEGESFAGCLCPAWDNQIIDKQPGQPIRILRGCTVKYTQFLSRTTAVMSMQVLDAIDGNGGLRGDVQRLESAITEVTRPLVQLSRAVDQFASIEKAIPISTDVEKITNRLTGD